jgi:hypothetical protein
MRRMKKLFAAFALISVLALTACSDYTGDAVVDEKAYSHGYSYLTMMNVNNSVIPITNYVPDSWHVALHDPAGKAFEISVSKADYEWVESGRTIHLNHGEINR